ncbi:protein U54 [Elephant endotheliotropic herpesvirus 3A]|uniref:Protein U54 n=1 Tax=Elephant endotheliotropic herpesvirus 3A TaxID=1329409 RepID=A0A866VSR8_9BETA|nr:protein U54 [Elephant endotheliotropic herpesvirus 3A]QOE74446.1 protein U54 [Elephant endotheliotropic herpesvirus 3A]
MIQPEWCYICHPSDGEYFSLVEVNARIEGTLKGEETVRLHLPLRISNHNTAGQLCVIGSMGNTASVIFSHIEYSDITGGYYITLTNPNSVPITFEQEVTKFYVLSMQTYNISHQTVDLRPPLTTTPAIQVNLRDELQVRELAEDYVFIKFRMPDVQWKEPKDFNLTGGPYWKTYGVAVIHLPDNLYSLQHYDIRESREASEVECDSGYAITRYVMHRVLYHGGMLYAYVSAIGSSPRARYATDLVFTGIFCTRFVAAATEVPRLDPAYNTTHYSLRDDRLHISNPAMHCNVFNSIYSETVGLFIPYDGYSGVLPTCVWRRGKVLGFPGTFAHQSMRGTTAIGDVVFPMALQPHASQASASPRDVSAAVTPTHLIIFPLNLTLRIDQLNPICARESAEQTHKLCLPDSAPRKPDIPPATARLFDPDDIQMVDAFFDSLWKLRLNLHARQITYKFTEDWNPWPSCVRHRPKQQVFCCYKLS